CRPVRTQEGEVPLEHGAIGRLRQAIAHGLDGDAVDRRLVGQREGNTRGLSVEAGRAAACTLHPLIALHAAVRCVGGLTLFEHDLDAVDAAVALVDQLEVVLLTVGPWNTQGCKRTRAVGQQRNELFLGGEGRADGADHARRDGCRCRGKFQSTLHLQVLLVSLHRLCCDPAEIGRAALLMTGPRLMREGPDPHLFLAYAPQSSQPVGLHDQEEDNQGAEHHVLDVRRGIHGQRQAEHMRDVGQQDGHQHHEGRAEEAADNGTQAANDDDEQQLQRTVQVEGQRLPRSQMNVGPQGAGHANDEGTDRERRQLRIDRTDPDHRGCHVHIANGHPLPPNGAAHQDFGQQREYHYEAQDEQIALHRGLHGHTEEVQRRHRHVAGRRVVGEEGNAQERPVHEELRREGRHRQVQPAYAQAGNAEHHAHQGGEHAPKKDLEQQRKLGYAYAEIPGGIGAYGHKGARPDRNLTAIAHQYVQADRRQRQNQEGNQNGLQEVVRCNEGNYCEGRHDHSKDDDAVLADREDLLVGPVRALELTVLTIIHSIYLPSIVLYTRSMIFSPKRP